MMITSRNSNEVVWSFTPAFVDSGTTPFARLLDTGNFVLKVNSNHTRKYAWQGFDHPTDTVLAGMKFVLYWKTGVTVNVTAWKSKNDPSQGPYYSLISRDTNVYIYSSSRKVWRCGPYDWMNLRSKGLDYNYVNNSRESAFWFKAGEKPMIVTYNSEGMAQLLSADANRWNLLWQEPANECSFVGHCGANGICDINATPVCSCLQGHVPKDVEKWGRGIWSDGCVRRTRLDCTNGTDGFLVVQRTKLPENSVMTASASSLDECRLVCQRKCSCVAYAIDGGFYRCVIWVNDTLTDTIRIDQFEQDLYIRVAAADLVSSSPMQTHKKKKPRKVMIILLSLLFGALICLATYVACLLKRRKTVRKVSPGAAKSHTTNQNESSTDLDIPLFNFNSIKAATDDFSKENELGRGGFGIVYKGQLGKNCQMIAVKRLASTSHQGIDEFKNEVKVIAKLQNVNLVRLLGCCIEGEERMLVYEYMPNRSLDSFLFDKEKGALLDWKKRYHIIIGIARGLLYLHHDSLFRIIHRDLKASNILLDSGMNPKISDFGMARIFGGDETDFNTRKIVGTYGYMSPEYAMEGIFSLKSDVYSFGVLILEIVSGKKNRGPHVAATPYLNLVAEAWSLWTEGESLKLADEQMSEGLSENDILRCIKVGLLCVQENAEDRPLMSKVIVMLGADVATLPEPKQPGFAARIGQFELDNISKTHDLSALNELTITILEGR